MGISRRKPQLHRTAYHFAQVTVYAMPSRARGPAHLDELSCVRRTEGVYADGEKFVIEDSWRERGVAHRVLPQTWSGMTTFRARKVLWSAD